MSDYRTGLHPTLLIKLDQVLAAMTALGHPMQPCSGPRTAQQQHDIWIEHPERTRCDGYVKKSDHQIQADGYGHAVDCCFSTGEAFGESQPWGTFGVCAETVGLIWGGRFTTIRGGDRPHVALPAQAIHP